jgi:tetratricopeptide (TPR) repeat protein
MDLDRDVRELMRSLHDADALRRTKLARTLSFPGDDETFMRSLHAFVLAALPAGSRAARIVQLCDVEGRPHKAVAAQLGLSMRHFYRERSAARRFVAEAIRSRQVVRVHHDGGDVLADELESVHEDVLRGRVATALLRAERILAAAPHEAARRDVLALRACALAARGDDAAGAVPLAANGGETASLAEAEYAAAFRLACAGDHVNALRRAKHAVALGDGAADGAERRRRAHARHLALLATLYEEDHEPRKAIGALETARELLLSCRFAPQNQVLHVSVQVASARLAVADMLDHGAAEALEAYRAASWHGLTLARSWAALVLAFAALAGRPSASALPLPWNALLDFSGAEGHWLGRLQLLVSRIYTTTGDTERALEAVRAACEAIPARHYLRAVADLRRAEALNAAGDGARALPLALGAIDRVAFGTRSHYVGSAHVAAARSLYLLGDVPQAREHCREGVQRLRGGAPVSELSQALHFAARVTGEARYAVEARLLLAG